MSETTDGPGNVTLHMTCGIDKLQSYDVSTPKGEFTVLHTPQFYFGGAYGAPQLPIITKLVQIPFGADFKVVVKNSDTTEYDLSKYGITNRVYPRQPSAPKDGSEVPFVYEKSAYIHKGFNGLPLTSMQEVGTMRNMRLALLTIAPIKYNAVDNKIAVYNNIEFDVVMTGANLKSDKAAAEAYATPAFAWAENMVLVPNSLRFNVRNAAQSYLIITDPMFKDAIAPFAAWKTQKGFKVDVVTTDKFGTGAAITEPLKAYIHN
ncbi:MAG TPA: C25 family peptidase propeptide domain-containing protein, partial [Candidatus Ozemobacteraceae bacterium]|nr:C25 family peptidase propeptide domain-containing protein [Candidatus Ozemobacteraceae bacterium]